MKKLFTVLFLCAAFVSCEDPKPIEKYYGNNYIITDVNTVGSNIQLKNADTIFRVSLIEFDLKNLKVGDTLK